MNRGPQTIRCFLESRDIQPKPFARMKVVMSKSKPEKLNTSDIPNRCPSFSITLRAAGTVVDQRRIATNPRPVANVFLRVPYIMIDREYQTYKVCC